MRQNYSTHSAQTAALSWMSRQQQLRATQHAGNDKNDNQQNILGFPDAAELIGIALRQARLGGFRPGSVPGDVMMQLGWCAIRGDAAAMLTLDYLHRRALATITAPDGSIRLEEKPSLASRMLPKRLSDKVVARPRGGTMDSTLGTSSSPSASRACQVGLAPSHAGTGGER